MAPTTETDERGRGRQGERERVPSHEERRFRARTERVGSQDRKEGAVVCGPRTPRVHNVPQVV